jgi:hypothetical protein
MAYPYRSILTPIEFDDPSVKAGEKVHQWPERKCIRWRGRGNRGLVSGRGSARGIAPSLLQRISNVVEQRAEQSYAGSRGG